MKKQIILKGFHRPLQLIPACFKNMRRGEVFSLSKTIMFTDSCRYRLPYGDQMDWNKLFGLCRRIHKDSGRFAWRYNVRTGMIEIAMYSYICGERNIDMLKSVPVNKPIKFSILRKYDYLCYYINDYLVGETWIGKKYNLLWGCGLYFGGNRRAPQTIIVKQKDLEL